VIHGFLKGGYWSEDIPRDFLQRAIDNSIRQSRSRWKTSGVRSCGYRPRNICLSGGSLHIGIASRTRIEQTTDARCHVTSSASAAGTW
jgi:hypothetical protein